MPSSSDSPENTEGPVTTADFIKPSARLRSSSVLSAATMPAPSSSGFFIANERNRSFVEHQTTQLPSRQKGAWLGVFTFLAVALLLLVVSVPSISNYRALQQNGVLVSGTVTARNTYVSHNKNGTTTTYSIAYEYTGQAANGEPQRYSASQNVYSDTYYRYPTGAAIGILYMSGNPVDSIIASDASNYISAVLYAIAGLVMVIVSLLFLFVLWRRMIAWAQLGREGVMLAGTLDSVTGRWISGKGAHYQVELSYSFVDLQTSEAHHKKISLTRNDLRYGTLPAVNTPVHVLFLNKRIFELM